MRQKENERVGDRGRVGVPALVLDVYKFRNQPRGLRQF